MVISENTSIPLVDLKAQYAGIQHEVQDAIHNVLQRSDFIRGQDVALFEEAFASFCDVPHAVGCNSGTDALVMACRALGIGPGDEVILPAFTFAASALGVSLNGARPVLVDVEPGTALLDPAQLAGALTEKTKAVIPVHLYGQMADMDPILDFARANDLFVIEDAAQAHGAYYGGKHAGTLGDVGCFSFYPGKNLGAYGDGGMVVTGDAGIDAQLRVLGNLGSEVKYHHTVEGYNSRLDTVQAAVLRVKLKYLEGWNDARKGLAAAYDEALAGIDGLDLTETPHDTVYHLYTVRVPGRDAVLKKLHEAGIYAGIHYPFALHELEAYRWLGYPAGAFPISEDWARRTLSLPIYAEMPESAVYRAAAVLKDALA